MQRLPFNSNKKLISHFSLIFSDRWMMLLIIASRRHRRDGLLRMLGSVSISSNRWRRIVSALCVGHFRFLDLRCVFCFDVNHYVYARTVFRFHLGIQQQDAVQHLSRLTQMEVHHDFLTLHVFLLSVTCPMLVLRLSAIPTLRNGLWPGESTQAVFDAPCVKRAKHPPFFTTRPSFADMS